MSEEYFNSFIETLEIQQDRVGKHLSRGIMSGAAASVLAFIMNLRSSAPENVKVPWFDLPVTPLLALFTILITSTFFGFAVLFYIYRVSNLKINLSKSIPDLTGKRRERVLSKLNVTLSKGPAVVSHLGIFFLAIMGVILLHTIAGFFLIRYLMTAEVPPFVDFTLNRWMHYFLSCGVSGIFGGPYYLAALLQLRYLYNLLE